ncbi:hypothetical protein VPNG_08035 [Cytospora leucostoma]|uniref:Cytochrome P450 n=1 Tax=Cytospora leucostoma TaxID=1230097 RepID=A0A423WR26_9PEZI|nr:hypothetical protein VPNG_08035 [Cytospora leucostoma]
MAFFPTPYFQPSQVASLLAVLGALLAITVWIRRDRRLDKMPGPPGWPLVGIGIGLPPRPIFTLHNWALEYGEVFKLRVGWYNWVVLNSPQAIKEILDKQASTITHPDLSAQGPTADFKALSSLSKLRPSSQLP